MAYLLIGTVSSECLSLMIIDLNFKYFFFKIIVYKLFELKSQVCPSYYSNFNN